VVRGVVRGVVKGVVRGVVSGAVRGVVRGVPLRSACALVLLSSPTVSTILASRVAMRATCATSCGMVAEKSSVCRVAAVDLRARRILSIAGRKPMSRSWSASSKMST
tara:strand:+ start:332 stop:652 length:321 start_codon:yes stop_codon:yes gene_type:complete